MNIKKLMDDVVEVIIMQNIVNSPFIQRQFGVDYLTAQKILRKLESWGYIQKGAECTIRKVLKHKYIE